ncbi:unnamed protein product [Acidithrix sp. C25]|nr:unnamed protein product [Acidithrix sp. C25]
MVGAVCGIVRVFSEYLRAISTDSNKEEWQGKLFTLARI